jgi:DNA polymerase-3 subunit gamma/tau
LSYLSLARKYRPNTFADLVGQESVGLALTNAIRLKREPRGVIFTGVRGIGKTTTARIYAKALNCEKGPTPEPCNVCASCLAIQHGTHEDVLEIDGASNTGVDDVRALQETLAYVPQRSSYKIYIIDEVHMLSVSAFNALLKTLEEPPEHVVFVFATTELHKVPETIQSRCQIFHLQKISTVLTKKRIADILVQENVKFDERAIHWIAREGKGSLRDALTLLDQVIAVGGGAVSWEAIEPMVNSGHAEPIYELLKMLLQKNSAGILAVIARWDQEGLAMTILVEELIKACRNAFVLKTIPNQSSELELLDLEEREQQALKAMGQEAKLFDLNRIFRTFVKCLDDLRNSELDRFVVENYALEWCLDPGLPDITALLQGQVTGSATSGAAAALQAGPITPAHSGPTAAANPSSAPVQAAVQAPKAEGAGNPPLDLRNRWKQTQSGNQGSGSAPASNAATKTEVSSIPSYASAPGRPEISPSPAVRIEVSTSSGTLVTASAALSPVALATAAVAAAATPQIAKVETVPQAPVYPPSPKVEEEIPSASETRAATVEQTTGLLSKTNSFAEKMQQKNKPKPIDTQDVSAAQAVAHVMDKPKPLSEAQARSPEAAQTPVGKADAVAASSGGTTPWPETWKHFVEEWKKQKPLQARVLEETYSLEYTRERIKLAVEAESLAGQKLLHLDTRRKLLVHFEQLFGFKGLFDVVPKSELTQATDNAPENRETLLETKQKVKARERDDLKTLLQDHPLTREAISAFDGTIEDIEVQ